MAFLTLLLVPSLAFLCASFFYTFALSKAPKGLREVPGPHGLPLLGNTLQLQSPPHPQFRAWAKQYGDLFKIQMGWYNWVFVNDPAAVKEIFDKQSAASSGRAPMPVGSDLLSGGKRFLFMSYTPQWRKLRALVHRLLTPKSSEMFCPSQEFEAKQLISDILEDNNRGDYESFYMHVRRYSTSVVMTSTYGRRIPQWDCEDIREVYGVMKEFSEKTTPGAYLADTLPPIAELIPVPLQWWRKSALQSYQRQEGIWLKYWNNLKQQMKEGKAPECFVKQWAETDYESQGIDETQAAFVAGTMIEAGSETTSSTLNSAIRYLAVYRDAQKKAHDELDRVVGNQRSPAFADEAQLPYVRACVKEILRIRPVATIGTPHFTTSDIVYKDYHIPKGTVVSINQYALHFDQRYHDPHAFIPERYLDHTLKAGAYTSHPDPLQRDHFSFGAGRRICPGMHLAENSLYITLAKILWAFEIRPCISVEGEEEKLDVSDDAYEPGTNTLPTPYRVRFIVRNKEVESALKGEWAQAKIDGYHLGNVKVDNEGVVVS